ncbi:hypothetical protein FACS1894204_01990 [Synergistales bacterium]|nr:hypothetical protein FACS1894204_01990 [Synergistales bacterium]
MKYGCFGDLADYDVVEELGFDSIELSLEEINALSDVEFAMLRQRIAPSHCKPHAVSRLIPLRERINDPNFKMQYWLDFFRRGAERTVALGTTMWVFGCGKPRCIAETEPMRHSTQAKVDKFILEIADILYPNKILLVIEPLGSPYSNYIGTVREATSFVNYYQHKNIAAMCDLRHMVNRGEMPETLPKFRSCLCHAHIDYPIGEKRLFPQEYDGYDYTAFFNALREMRYDGILTIEAIHKENLRAEGSQSLLFLKRNFQ